MSPVDSCSSLKRNIDSDLTNARGCGTVSDQSAYSPIDRNPLSKSGPVGNLPYEVLTEIFIWCCPTFKDHYRGPPLSAVTLSHVCRSWRNAAFTTPRLWTFLTLEVAYSDAGRMGRACEQLKLWTDRAQNCPLLVEVEFVESPHRWPAANVFNEMQQLVRVALECRPLLHSEDMELRAALDATSVSPPLPRSSSQALEQYTWAKSGTRPDRPSPGSVQIHASRLAEIMFGLEGHSTIGRHLTHIDLRDPDGEIRLSVEECQVALWNFPGLEFCALRMGASADEVAEPVVLWRLRTLSLSWSDRVEVGALLDSITAPSLGELELRGPLFPKENYPENRWPHVSELLHRSAASLWALTLANLDGTTMELLRCLALCQGLQHLSLERCILDEELMDLLQFGEGLIHEQARRTILGLDYLGLIGCDVFELNDFLRVSLEIPFWEEAQLSRLYIINSGFVSEDILSTIRRLPLEEFETDPALLEEFE